MTSITWAGTRCVHELATILTISEDIDDEDITFAHVRHSLPSQKEKKKHSLTADVQENRSAVCLKNKIIKMSFTYFS